MDELDNFRKSLGSMLEYYGIEFDLNYKTQNGTIDLVGYVNNRNQPDLSILIEGADKFDAQKYLNILNEVPSLRYKYIIALNDKIKVEGDFPEIKIFQNPLEDYTFQNEIANITKSNKAKFEFSNLKSLRLNIDNATKYEELIEEIRDQGLDENKADKILFDIHNLGKIFVGKYQTKDGNSYNFNRDRRAAANTIDAIINGNSYNFNRDIESSPELKFLMVTGLLDVKTTGSYSQGKYVEYALTEEGEEIAGSATGKIVNKNYKNLDKIFAEYGEKKVFFSFLGNEFDLGKFVHYDEKHEFYGFFYSGSRLGNLEELSEEYGIQGERLNKMHLVPSCPLFADEFAEIFDEMVNINLGSKKNYFTASSNYYGILYSIPFDFLISKERMQEISKRIDDKTLDEFAIYYMLRASIGHESDERKINKINLRELNDLSLNEEIVNSILEELKADKIISKPIKNDYNLIIIYQPEQLKAMTEEKLIDLMDILTK
ncbi:MAG: hypothetical protein ACP5MU_06775 [Thermoplasmata archaeon]